MRFSSVLILAATGLACSFSVFAGGLPDSGRDGSSASMFSAKPQASTGSGTPADAPFVYRQVGYLATVGPAPLRFGPGTPACNERTPPRVASTSRKPVFTAPGAPQAPASPEVTPSTFVPTSIVTGETRSNPTDEVINFFRPQEVDPELQKRRLRFMFDPVQGFQAAPPPVPVAPPSAPPSRATFRQN